MFQCIHFHEQTKLENLAALPEIWYAKLQHTSRALTDNLYMTLPFILNREMIEWNPLLVFSLLKNIPLKFTARSLWNRKPGKHANLYPLAWHRLREDTLLLLYIFMISHCYVLYCLTKTVSWVRHEQKLVWKEVFWDSARVVRIMLDWFRGFILRLLFSYADFLSEKGAHALELYKGAAI